MDMLRHPLYEPIAALVPETTLEMVLNDFRSRPMVNCVVRYGRVDL